MVRVNIRKVKALVWLASVATFVFAGWTFYDIFTRKQAKHYENRTRDFFVQDVLKANVHEASGSRQKPFYAQASFEQLWLARVDGSRKPPPDKPGSEGPAPEPDLPKAPPIETVLDVGLILWATEPESRFIAVTYGAPGAAGAPAAGGAAVPSAAGKASRLHLSEGDPLKPPFDAAPYNGKVLRIEQQEVTFQWGEGESKITPGLGANGSGEPLNMFVIGVPDDAAAGITEPPETTTALKDGHWIMGQQDLDKARNDPQKFLDEQIHLRTVTPAAGGRSALEITSDPPAGSLAAQLGAKKGDKIISVNGIPMSSMSGAISWFKQNSNLPTYVVVYEPAGTGKLETLVFHVK